MRPDRSEYARAQPCSRTPSSRGSATSTLAAARHLNLTTRYGASRGARTRHTRASPQRRRRNCCSRAVAAHAARAGDRLAGHLAPSRTPASARALRTFRAAFDHPRDRRAAEGGGVRRDAAPPTAVCEKQPLASGVSDVWGTRRGENEATSPYADPCAVRRRRNRCVLLSGLRESRTWPERRSATSNHPARACDRSDPSGPRLSRVGNASRPR